MWLWWGGGGLCDGIALQIILTVHYQMVSVANIQKPLNPQPLNLERLNPIIGILL